MEDTLISFGGELKSIGEGRFEGYLVRFKSESQPDLDGEFFHQNTEFFIEDGAVLPVLYEHGLDPTLKRRKIGMGKVTRKDAGLWFELQLQRRDEYEEYINTLGLQGKLGLSSGAANHMVLKTSLKSATRIDEWGLAEGSVTVSPCDYENAVMPLKSYATDERQSAITLPAERTDASSRAAASQQVRAKGLAALLLRHIEDRLEDGQDREMIIKSLAREASIEAEDVEAIIAGEQLPTNARLKAFSRVLNISYDQLKAGVKIDRAKTIKGMFEEALAEHPLSRWQLDNIYCDIVKKIAATAQASSVTGVEFDFAAKVKEASGEYLERLESMVVMQITDYVDSGEDEPFYLKAALDLTDALSVAEGIGPDEHSKMVATAVRELTKRFERFHQNRLKVGRVLSDKNRQRLVTLVGQIKQAVSDCEMLLEESQPKATDSEKRAALTRHLMLRHQHRPTIGA